ncbi:MAG: hypothetical protein C0478_01300 [Planctomyces sp.]|nr:hypothetical protein [Planctomyces sp.]
MVAEIVTAGAVLLMLFAEMMHARRVDVAAALAFGPSRRPASWVRAAAPLRIIAAGALAWGLVTLLLLQPKVHQISEPISESERKHLLIALDVSPSMRLQDAGPTGKQSRISRASDLLGSVFQRVPMQMFRTSVIAFYSDAKPVVVETIDLEVVRNILDNLPMDHAFKSGKTDLFAGIAEAAKTAKPLPPRSATLLIFSDGDSVPATGMPKLPASINQVIVVGLGDHLAGRFIDGKHSRQEVSTLKQVALRLGGSYHNGNDKHLSTDLLRAMSSSRGESLLEQLTKREYALLAITLGALLLSLLPLALHYAGTAWTPGVMHLRSTRGNFAGNAHQGRAVDRRSAGWWSGLLRRHS